jgi:hypothetical protein
MITRISIENFKGIGDRITVPFRPITLLFGPNSAGKSSIMHAIHYAREVLERHNLDADETLTGGESVKLGGFHEMVHRHEDQRAIKIRFDLDFSSVKWDELLPIDEYLFPRGTYEDDLSTLGLDIMSGWVELWVGYDDDASHRSLAVVKYEVGLEDRHFATIESAPVEASPSQLRAGAILTKLNLHHPAIAWADPEPNSAGPIDRLFPDFGNFLETAYYSAEDSPATPEQLRQVQLDAEASSGDNLISILKSLDEFRPETIRVCDQEKIGTSVKLWIGMRRDSDGLGAFAVAIRRPASIAPDTINKVLTVVISQLVDEQDISIPLPGMIDAAPDWTRRLQFHSSIFSAISGEEGADEMEAAAEHEKVNQRFVEQLLTRMIVGPGQVLRDCLEGFRYVGPLRTIPPRNHEPPRLAEPARWASGLAAWELLATPGNDNLVANVTEWLWRDDCLNTGYQLVVKRVREVEQDFQEQMLRLEWEEESPSAKMNDVLSELRRQPERCRLYLRDVEKNTDVQPHGVGVGLSQVVPVITACVAAKANVVQLEQPELHLHPTQQAAIGDLLIHGALQKPRKMLLVETHSEHLILRILKRIRQTSKGAAHRGIAVTPDDMVVLYVEPQDGQTGIFEIGVGGNGEFLQPWPDKFFDQDYEERYG